MLTTACEISNSDDMIDLRDVIDRYEDLEASRENAADDSKEEGEALAIFDESEEGREYKLLGALLDDLKGYGGDEQWRGDWYPITLIRDSYFVEAMRELCEDIGDFPKGIPGYYVIDWEATARNLRVDYSSVEFDNVTYWYR
jgi:hypothetical protein